MNRFVSMLWPCPLLCLFMISVCSAQSNGQPSISLKNRLIKLNVRLVSQNEGIPYARVNILTLANKAIALKTTDITGRCTFSLPDSLNGKIRLSVSSLDYEEFKSDIISLDTLPGSEQLFVLKKSSIQLSEVQIFQKQIVHNGEKLVYNLRHDQFSASTSTAELFTKMPGVILSSSGELKLNGRSGVLILIDGKGELKSLSEQLLMLSGLSSDQVEKVEIISNPSARYDANVTSVINVITKKVKGFSNFRSSYSQPLFADGKNFGNEYPSGGMGTNLNFLLGKIRSSFFLNVSNNTGLENSTESRSIVGLSRYNSTSYSNFASFSIMPSISFDYDINERSSVGLNADFGFNPTFSRKTTSTYDFYNYATNVLDSTVLTSSKYATDSWRTRVTGNYKYKLDTIKNSFMYLNFIYSRNPYSQHNNLQNNINNTYFVSLANNLKGHFDIYSASAIFSNLLKRKYLSTEVGIKFNSLENTTTQTLNNNISDFNYLEQLSALFLTIRWTFDNYILISEIRNELLESKTTFSAISTQSVSSNYFKMYPNLLIQKTIGSQTSASLGYSKRVKRPQSVYMNPSQSISNYYYRTSGNLVYLPGYTDKLEGQIRYKNFGSTVYYEHAINQRVLLPTSDPFVFQGANIGKFNSYGISLNYIFSIKKWFSSNNNFDFSNTSQGDDNYIYSRDRWLGFSASSANDFTLGKRTRLNVSMYYSSNSYSAFGIFGEVFSSSIDVKQLFFKNRLSLNLGIEDPFGIKKLRSSTIYPMQSQETKQFTNNRIVSFQLIYKFRFGRNFIKQGFKDKSDGEIRY